MTDVLIQRALYEVGRRMIFPEMFGARNATSINKACQLAKQRSGMTVRLTGGTWTCNETIVLEDGVPLLLEPTAVIQRGTGFVGTMLQSRNFSQFKGSTDSTKPFPIHIQVTGGRVDGRYMNDAFTSYVEEDGGNGIEIYARRIVLDTMVENMPGIGVWCESSVALTPAVNSGRHASIRLHVSATKYEGFVWKGPSDHNIETVFCSDSGAVIASESAANLTSSPTYGGTNGGFTDGVVIDTGAEIGMIHSFGHTSGRGIVINGGRINAGLLEVDSCRYGACRILGGYGVIANLVLYRSGGYSSNALPMLDFNSPDDDSVGWKISGKIYHKDSAYTTPRNLVEIGDNARLLQADLNLTGDNVPGHGVVIKGSANYLTLNIVGDEINGTGPDAAAATMIHRTASAAARSYRITGYARNVDCVFRTSGAPDVETVDVTFDLDTGQVAFAGDAPTKDGQDWNLRGTINGVFKGSKVTGVTAAFDSNSTSDQSQSFNHNLITTPRRYDLLGMRDTGTGITTASLQYAYASAVDASQITAHVKFAIANGSDTQPIFGWRAEV